MNGIRIVEAPPNKEFDPSNPHDIMCETFRRQVTEMVLSADRITIYRDMGADQRLSAFMVGALAGVIGVALASIREEAHDMMIENIIVSIPAVRKQVESIIANSGSKT